MGDFPGYRMPPPPILTTFHPECAGDEVGAAQGLSASSGAWPANNLALFFPFRISDWATVFQLLFYVGATSSGTLDMAVYDAQKHRLVSAGDTAMSVTTNTVQELNVTDTVLAPGDYLLAASCSSTSGTVFRQTAADEIGLPRFPIYEQAGLTAATLPDPCVPVVMTQSNAIIPWVGIQFRSVY